MKKTIKFLSLTFGEILFLIFLLIILPSIFINQIYDQNDFGESFFVPLSNSTIYQQEIKLNYANLESLSLLLKNPNLENKDPIYIDIEESNGQTLYQIALSGHSIEDPTWVPLKFLPIDKEQIILKINSPSRNEPLISLAFNKKDNSLVYQARYKINSFKERFQKNLKLQKNKLSKNYLYLSIYISLILILNLLLVQSDNKRRLV